ncbi:MAG: hypothetical protein RL347_64 [Actinomycetota bacterium]
MTDEAVGSPTVPAEEPIADPAGSGAHAAPRRSALGIWAFALALLGLVALPIVGSVLGFALGRVAIRKADAGPLLGGRGLAIAAVVISLVTLVVIALSVAAYALSIAYLEI